MRVQLYILVELNFGDFGIFGGRKTEDPGEIPQSKARTNNKLNPYDNGPKSNLGHIGGSPGSPRSLTCHIIFALCKRREASRHCAVVYVHARGVEHMVHGLYWATACRKYTDFEHI